MRTEQSHNCESLPAGAIRPLPADPEPITEALSSEQAAVPQPQVSGSIPQPQNTTTQQPEAKDKQPVIANWISFGTLILSFVVFYWTYQLFKQTEVATNAAVRSSNISENALNEQKHMDSVMRYRDKVKDSTDSVDHVITANNDRKRFKLDSSSIQAQIVALNISQKQFLAQNEPYLQIDHVNIDTFQIGKSISVRATISNLGIYPVKVLRSDMASSIRFTIPNFSAFVKMVGNTPKILNQYITKDTHFELGLNDFIPLNEETYKNLNNRNRFFYLVGRIEYQNLINKQTKNYRFLIKISLVDSHVTYEYLTNETSSL